MSDTFFTKYDIRGNMDSSTMLETVWNTGKALADWLPTSGAVLVIADHNADERLVNAVTEGLTLQGRNVMRGLRGNTQDIPAQVTLAGASGAALVGFDTILHVATLSLYQHEGALIDINTGIDRIKELVLAGNFVPAAQKGQITKL